MSSVSPVGTLAYIIDEQALLVRVNNGWQYIAVSIPVHNIINANAEFSSLKISYLFFSLDHYYLLQHQHHQQRYRHRQILPLKRLIWSIRYPRKLTEQG